MRISFNHGLIYATKATGRALQPKNQLSVLLHMYEFTNGTISHKAILPQERVMVHTVESVSETMVMLMKSTGTYVQRRIHVKLYRDIYIFAMRSCIASATERALNPDAIKKDIINLIEVECIKIYPKSFFKARDKEREYFTLACTQALDIVIKLNARFNTGTSDSEPRGYKNKGWFIPVTDNIFD